MNKKEIVNKIKDLLAFNAEAEVVAEVTKFVEVKDVEGKVLSQDSEELVVGATIMIEGVVAEAGDYVLEDGRTVVVDETGVVAEIKDAPEEEQKVVEAPAVESPAVESEVEMAEVAELEAPAVVGAETPAVEAVTEEVQAEIDEVVDNNDEESTMVKRMDSLEDLVRKLVEKQDRLIEANVAMSSIIEDYGNEVTKEDLKVVKADFNSDKKAVKESALDSLAKFRTKTK